MRRVRRRYAAIVVGVVVIAAVEVWHHSWRFWPRPPHIDTALADTAGPIIDGHLETSPDLTWKTIPGELHPRWFCTERPIETTRDGSRTRVGLEAECGEYARRGGDLLIGGAWSGPLVVTLDRGKVVHVQQPIDGAGFVPSVNRMFSERGAAEYWRRYRLKKEMAAPEDEARVAFGLPPGTPVRHF
ncbi:hypothetical protein GCM10010404_00320 [Nonomuraea africana]|uniref:Uncharacterized protein n=1 Tax=Nonomuraea africana TaxID=46171 RepID=A0ABR9KDF8_9ACTN|nr:hypothetical protein [Nonomuraea africana]MBE1559587.1 hypothetical protein [Nonomuraea africana]